MTWWPIIGAVWWAGAVYYGLRLANEERSPSGIDGAFIYGGVVVGGVSIILVAGAIAESLGLAVGEGVGGAILSNGKLMTGTIGRAGHLGHMSQDIDGPPSIANMPGAIEWYIPALGGDEDLIALCQLLLFE